MLAYNNIVVGTDFSPGSDEGVAAAIRVANRFEARRVHLVHVVQSSPMLPPPLMPDPSHDAATTAAVQRAEERLDAMELPKTKAWVQREVCVGSPARELALASDRHHADLLVVARRGHSPLARLVLGSVPNSLIRVAHCPVLVVGDDREDAVSFERILAAVDLSPVSMLVLHHAVAVARAYGGRVQVLSLHERPGNGADGFFSSSEGLEEARLRHEEALDSLVRKVASQGVPVEMRVMKKAPISQTIIEVAGQSEADLIVMGTSGRNAWHRMILGSTANHVLLRSPCGVLVVPPAARVSAEEPDEVLATGAALGGNTPF